MGLQTIVVEKFPGSELRARIFSTPSPKPSTSKGVKLMPPHCECEGGFFDGDRTDQPSPLDESFKLKTPPEESSKPRRRRGESFTLNAKRRIKRAGRVLDEIAKPEECVFLTGTLPGSTRQAMAAMAAYAPYIVNGMKAWIAKRVPSKMDFYVWELQGRGALHIHYCLWVPDPIARSYILKEFRNQWVRLIRSVGKQAGVDMFARQGGGSWRDRPDVVQAYAQTVRKSVGAYLAKYTSKSAGKGFGGFHPKRWWGVSRPMSAAIAERTETYRLDYIKESVAQGIYEDFKSFIERDEANYYHWNHKVTSGRSLICWNFSPELPRIFIALIQSHRRFLHMKTYSKSASSKPQERILALLNKCLSRQALSSTIFSPPLRLLYESWCSNSKAAECLDTTDWLELRSMFLDSDQWWRCVEERKEILRLCNENIHVSEL